MRELEIKARVTDETVLRQRISDIGIQLSNEITQHDVVYGWPGAEDNPTQHNWLRIRIENDSRSIFTIKRAVSGQLDNIEHETEINDPRAMHEAILLLGYVKWSDILKKRQKGRFPDDGDVELCLDSVEGIGVYIELEKIVDTAADNVAEERKLWELLESLGIDKSQIETRGYDAIVRNSKKL